MRAFATLLIQPGDELHIVQPTSERPTIILGASGNTIAFEGPEAVKALRDLLRDFVDNPSTRPIERTIPKEAK